MTDTVDSNPILACPRCDKSPLDATTVGFECAGCKTKYPNLGGIPWLFAEPQATLAEWQGRWQLTLRQLDRDAQRLDKAMAQRKLRASTRARLTHLQSALRDHAERLREILQPLELASMTGDYATYLALRTRLPTDQGLMTYYANIHRDWHWGDRENEATLGIVSERLAEREPGRILVLGAGAGRLAYDVHNNLSATFTIGLDFNPLLVFLANRICGGGEAELYEFPMAPKSANETAVLRKLRAPHPAHEGLSFVQGDAHRPPFANESFDTIITPWLIDIVPESLDDFSARINALLAKEGRWINLGSLSFHTADPAQRYSHEECADVLSENGFAEPAMHETRVPYMCSPASRHGRMEELLSWSATKTGKARKVAKYTALPEWLVRGKEPVPLLESFKVQAMSTRIHAFIMSLIDGKRNLQDIAQLVVQQQLMSPTEAEPAIRTFLIRMFDESAKIGE